MGLSLKSKRVVVTDGREIGALTTSNLLAGVSGRTAIFRISSGMMEGCVVPAVLPRTGGKSNKIEEVLT